MDVGASRDHWTGMGSMQTASNYEEARGLGHSRVHEIKRMETKMASFEMMDVLFGVVCVKHGA